VIYEFRVADGYRIRTRLTVIDRQIKTPLQGEYFT